MPCDPSHDAIAYSCNGVISTVVDGDTIKIKVYGSVNTGRAASVDTPESMKPGVPVERGALRARSIAIKWSFSKRNDEDGDDPYDRCRNGPKVTHRTDLTQDKTDRFGRPSVYFTRSGTGFALSQVTAGWGEVYVDNNVPLKNFSAFQADQDRAKEANLGVRGYCGRDFHLENP